MSVLDRIEGPRDLKALSLGRPGRARPGMPQTSSSRRSRRRADTWRPTSGVVELTLALHRAFDSPKDRIVWDTSNQCYTHKLVTGRRDSFATIRTPGGLSGFAEPRGEPARHAGGRARGHRRSPTRSGCRSPSRTPPASPTSSPSSATGADVRARATRP